MLTHISIGDIWYRVYAETYDEVSILHPETGKLVWIQIKSVQKYIYSYS